MIFTCNLSLSYMRRLRVSQLYEDGIKLTHQFYFFDLFLKFPVFSLVFGILGAGCNTLCVIFGLLSIVRKLSGWGEMRGTWRGLARHGGVQYNRDEGKYNCTGKRELDVWWLTLTGFQLSRVQRLIMLALDSHIRRFALSRRSVLSLNVAIPIP